MRGASDKLGKFEEYFDPETGHQFRAAEIKSELILPEDRDVGAPGQYLIENHVTGSREIVENPQSVGLSPEGSIVSKVARLLCTTPIRIAVISDDGKTLKEFRSKVLSIVGDTSSWDRDNILVFRVLEYGDMEIIIDQEDNYDYVLVDKGIDISSGQFNAIHDINKKSSEGDAYRSWLPKLEAFRKSEI